jgi:hypothetical protein
MLLPPRTLGPTAAAASLLLLLARDADQRGAHAATAAAFLEWAAPTFALLSASAAVALLQPRPKPEPEPTLRVYPAAGQPLPPARAALRDAESLALSVPACVVINGITLATIHLGSNPEMSSSSLIAHSHVLCWALDWLGVAPALLLGRAALASDGYRFDDPADWRSAHEWSTTGQVLFTHPSTVNPGCEVEVRAHAAGWRTLRFVLPNGGGSVQSVHRLSGAGTRDVQAIANEYLKTMAAAALVLFRRRREATTAAAPAADVCLAPAAVVVVAAGSPADMATAAAAVGWREGATAVAAAPAANAAGVVGGSQPRMLFLGVGGGSLVSLFGCLYPGAEIVAVELDQVRIVKKKRGKPQKGNGAKMR